VSRSTFGRTLLAVRDNEERAAAIGYNLRLLKLQAFVISGAVTGLAGALHAMMTGLAPLSNAEYHTSEMILVMTVIGGRATCLPRCWDQRSTCCWPTGCLNCGRVGSCCWALH